MKECMNVMEYGRGEVEENKHLLTPLHLHSNTSSLGLSLIEVMLAIVILGVGSGVLMLATGRCLAVISKARHYSTAHRLILRVEAEHPIPRGEIDAETESGNFDDEDYTWEREITEEDDENRPGLYTVRTRVSWSARGKASFEEVVTWRYVEPKEPKVF